MKKSPYWTPAFGLGSEKGSYRVRKGNLIGSKINFEKRQGNWVQKSKKHNMAIGKVLTRQK